VVASLLSLIRPHRGRPGRIGDALFLAGLAVTFVVQLIQGVQLLRHPGETGAVNTIAVLVLVCFLIGIARAWELIGGPTFGIFQEIAALFRRPQQEADKADRN
jgi:hypothetical protein